MIADDPLDDDARERSLDRGHLVVDPLLPGLEPPLRALPRARRRPDPWLTLHALLCAPGCGTRIAAPSYIDPGSRS
jgi:hypothetical protein